MRTAALLRRSASALAVVAVVATSVLVAAPAMAAPGPDIVITSPADGAVQGPNSWLVVTGYVSDPAQSYTYQLDAGGLGPVTPDSGGYFSFGLVGPNGSHTLTISGGGSSASVGYTLDDVGPEVTITSPSEGEVLRNTLLLAYTLGDAVSSWISWDAGIETPLVAPSPLGFDVSGMTEGAHQVHIRSVDGFGNQTAVTRNVVIDHTAPTVSITMPGNGSWIDPAQPFTIMASSDDAGTQSWDLRVDGSTVAGGPGGTPIAYGMPAPASWTNNSVHTITAQSTDAVGNVGNLATVTVRADTRKPDVTIAAPVGTLHAGSSISGTATDAGSGVASVQLDFRKLRADESCGAVQFSGTATLTGGNWSLALPGAAVSGAYCLRATATDGVGHTRVAADQPHAVVDVTGPDAPRRLTPDGEVWSVDTIGWRAVDDAASYEYRIAAEEYLLGSAEAVAVTGTVANPENTPDGYWYWQVRGIDEHGNAGAWSDAAQVTVIPVPVIDDCGTPLLCQVFGDELFLSWESVPQAAAYQVEYSWTGGTSDLSDDIVKTRTIAATGGSLVEAQIHLGNQLPDGAWSVRVRVVLDDKVDPGATRRGPWSASVAFTRDSTRPDRPVVLGPSSATPLTNPDVQLRWTEDDSVIFWDLKLSTTGERGPGGVNLRHPDQRLMVFDPDGVALFVLLLGDLGGLEGTPEELQELLDDPSCESIEALLGDPGDDTEFLCGDASVVLSQLADGDYWWQVRGYDLISLLGELLGGLGGSECGCGSDAGLHGPSRWSEVATFTIDRDYVAPSGGNGAPPASNGGPGVKGDSVSTTADTSGDPVAEDGTASEEGEESGSGGDSAGGGSSDGGDGTDEGSRADGTREEPADDGFPVGWLIGGIVALIVLAGGGAFLGLRLRRG